MRSEHQTTDKDDEHGAVTDRQARRDALISQIVDENRELLKRLSEA